MSDMTIIQLRAERQRAEKEIGAILEDLWRKTGVQPEYVALETTGFHFISDERPTSVTVRVGITLAGI
jgi:hypothetical protein